MKLPPEVGDSEGRDELGQLLDDDVDPIGARLAACILRSRFWMHRSLHTVTFHGTDAAHHEIRREFTPPVYAPQLLDEEFGRDAMLLPVLRLRKAAFFDLRAVDEGGAQVPTYPSTTRSAFGFAALDAISRWKMGASLGDSPTIARDVRDIIRPRPDRGPRPERERAAGVSLVEHFVAGAADPEDATQREALLNAYEFRRMLSLLDVGYLVFTAIEPRFARARSLTFTLAQPMYADALAALGAPLRSIGFAPQNFSLSITDLPDDGSTHVEVELPDGLRCAEAAAYTGSSTIKPVETTLQRRVRFYFGRDREEPRVVIRIGALPDRSLRLIALAPLAALLTGIALAIVDVHIRTLDRNATVTVLTIAPALLALIAERTGEAPLTSKLLRGYRLLVVIPVLLALMAALTIATGTKGEVSDIVPISSALCFAISVALAIAALSAARYRG